MQTQRDFYFCKLRQRSNSKYEVGLKYRNWLNVTVVYWTPAPLEVKAQAKSQKLNQLVHSKRRIRETPATDTVDPFRVFFKDFLLEKQKENLNLRAHDLTVEATAAWNELSVKEQQEYEDPADFEDSA